MGIVKEIKDRVADHVKITGMRPTRIYLGEQEMAELLISIEPFLIAPGVLDSVRYVFDGMSVFEVKDDATHIWCCV